MDGDEIFAIRCRRIIESSHNNLHVFGANLDIEKENVPIVYFLLTTTNIDYLWYDVQHDKNKEKELRNIIKLCFYYERVIDFLLENFMDNFQKCYITIGLIKDGLKISKIMFGFLLYMNTYYGWKELMNLLIYEKKIEITQSMFDNLCSHGFYAYVEYLVKERKFKIGEEFIGNIRYHPYFDRQLAEISYRLGNINR